LYTWAAKYDFTVGQGTPYTVKWYKGPANRKIGKIIGLSIDDANLGLFGKAGSIDVYFYYDQSGEFLSYSVMANPYADRVAAFSD
jgi:hypothetical protein